MSAWALAIDFGSSFTTAATVTDRVVRVLDVLGSRRLASVVLLDRDGELIVGEEADREAAVSPDRVERGPKRAVGSRMVLLGGTPVLVVDLVAALLSVLVDEAVRQHGGEPPARVALTHPARWGPERLAVLIDAATKTGLDPATIELVPEPVAAAALYAKARSLEGDAVAVYDLGGGTFDTAVLRRTDQGLETVGTPGGDETVGGEAFDHLLYRKVGEHVAAVDASLWVDLTTNPDRRWRHANTDLFGRVRAAKEALSTRERATVFVAEADLVVSITRSEFEDLVIEDIERTAEILGRTVDGSGMGNADLAAVYLVGGSSRIPLIGRRLTETFGERLATWDDPQLAVVLGAAELLRGDHGLSRDGALETAESSTVPDEPPTEAEPEPAPPIALPPLPTPAPTTPVVTASTPAANEADVRPADPGAEVDEHDPGAAEAEAEPEPEPTGEDPEALEPVIDDDPAGDAAVALAAPPEEPPPPGEPGDSGDDGSRRPRRRDLSTRARAVIGVASVGVLVVLLLVAVGIVNARETPLPDPGDEGWTQAIREMSLCDALDKHDLMGFEYNASDERRCERDEPGAGDLKLCDAIVARGELLGYPHTGEGVMAQFMVSTAHHVIGGCFGYSSPLVPGSAAWARRFVAASACDLDGGTDLPRLVRDAGDDCDDVPACDVVAALVDAGASEDGHPQRNGFVACGGSDYSASTTPCDWSITTVPIDGATNEPDCSESGGNGLFVPTDEWVDELNRATACQLDGSVEDFPILVADEGDHCDDIPACDVVVAVSRAGGTVAGAARSTRLRWAAADACAHVRNEPHSGPCDWDITFPPIPGVDEDELECSESSAPMLDQRESGAVALTQPNA
jgi:hypothetical protein